MFSGTGSGDAEHPPGRAAAGSGKYVFIGSLLNAVMILSIWQTGSCRACIIGLILPVGAFLQGQLPLVLMIPVIALGNICYMVWAHVFRRSRTAVLPDRSLKPVFSMGEHR